jgi:hypothetical protein
VDDTKRMTSPGIDAKYRRRDSERCARVFRRGAIVAIINPRLDESRFLPLVLDPHSDIAARSRTHDASGADDNAGVGVSDGASRTQGDVDDRSCASHHW